MRDLYPLGPELEHMRVRLARVGVRVEIRPASRDRYRRFNVRS